MILGTGQVNVHKETGQEFKVENALNAGKEV